MVELKVGAMPDFVEDCTRLPRSPTTSVSSERIFSGGADLMTANRNRLNEDSVQMAMSLKYWRKHLRKQSSWSSLVCPHICAWLDLLGETCETRRDGTRLVRHPSRLVSWQPYLSKTFKKGPRFQRLSAPIQNKIKECSSDKRCADGHHRKSDFKSPTTRITRSPVYAYDPTGLLLLPTNLISPFPSHTKKARNLARELLSPLYGSGKGRLGSLVITGGGVIRGLIVGGDGAACDSSTYVVGLVEFVQILNSNIFTIFLLVI